MLKVVLPGPIVLCLTNFSTREAIVAVLVVVVIVDDVTRSLMMNGNDGLYA